MDTRVGSRTGETVVSVGDIDGDGIDDYAVGGPLGDARMRSECGWVRAVSGADNETIDVSDWEYSKPGEVPLTFCGFGGGMSVLNVLRESSPCRLLAVSSSRWSMARGIVCFDLDRVGKGTSMARAAIWEATQIAAGLDLRTPRRE